MGLRRRLERAEARAPKAPRSQAREEPPSVRLLKILRILKTAWARRLGAAEADRSLEEVRWEHRQFSEGAAVLEEYHSWGLAAGAHTEYFCHGFLQQLRGVAEANRPGAPPSPWRAHWPWHRNSGPPLAEHLRQCLAIDLTRSRDAR
jgi:hypothetical protein